MSIVLIQNRQVYFLFLFFLPRVPGKEDATETGEEVADAVVAASPLTEGAGEEVALKDELKGLLGTGVVGAPIGLAFGEVGADD